MPIGKVSKYRTLVLYGPQGCGKTTRLGQVVGVERRLRARRNISGIDPVFIIRKHHIENGLVHFKREIEIPDDANHSYLVNSVRRVHHQHPMQSNYQHVIIDEAQNMPKDKLFEFYNVIEHYYPGIPVLFSCYLLNLENPNIVMPTTLFLLHWCTRRLFVKRHCTFCNRTAVTDLHIVDGHKTNKTVNKGKLYMVCTKHFNHPPKKLLHSSERPHNMHIDTSKL